MTVTGEGQQLFRRVNCQRVSISQLDFSASWRVGPYTQLLLRGVDVFNLDRSFSVSATAATTFIEQRRAERLRGGLLGGLRIVF